VVPGLVDLVFVGVDVVGVGGGRDCLVDECQRVGVERVVVVEQGEELAFGELHRVVRGGDDAAVLGPEADPHAGVLGLRPLEDLAHVRLLRAVVDEDVLPVVEALPPNRTEHRFEYRGRRFVDGGEDGEAGHGRGVSRARAAAPRGRSAAAARAASL